MVWWVGNPFVCSAAFKDSGVRAMDDESGSGFVDAPADAPVDLPRFTTGEAETFERVRFEQSMATIGMGLPRLPWEQGVFAEIFNTGGGMVSHAMNFMTPLPGVFGAGFNEERQAAPVIDPELDVPGAEMPIFAKHVKALSDKDYDKQVSLQWTRALATWLAIHEGCGFDSSVGNHVQAKLAQQDRDGALMCIRDACGVRSPNTVLKRGRDLQLFFSWTSKSEGKWWPIKELHLLEYIRWTEKVGKSKLIGKNLQHGLKFFKYVMGGHFDLEKLITPLMMGLVSRIASTKNVVDQARALTVAEVQSLEIQLEKSKYALDRYYLGCILFALYSRSRWSDMSNLATFEFDVIQTSSGPFGFVEGRSRIHKTATSEERKTLYMPFVAPIWGVTAKPWGLHFKAALEEVGMLSGRDPFGPLCRATRPDGTFTIRALTSAEGSSMMNDYLKIKPGADAETTSHSLKATTLIWSARFGMDEYSRLLLGHHSTKENSLACYSRDLLAKPLRELGGLLTSIRTGQFQPDGTRSGWMNPMEAGGSDGPGQEDWTKLMEQERGHHGDVASASLGGLSAAGEVESEWSAVTVPTVIGELTPLVQSSTHDKACEEKVPELPAGFDDDFFDGDFFKEPDSRFEPVGLDDPPGTGREAEQPEGERSMGRLDLGSFPEEEPCGEDEQEVDFAESASSEDESLDSTASDDNEEKFHEAQADDVMYQVPMAVEGDLLQNKKSRMLHIRSKDEGNNLQPVSLCGVHGGSYMRLPYGARFAWPKCSKCFKSAALADERSVVDAIGAKKRRRQL